MHGNTPTMFYTANFITLGTICSFLFFRQRSRAAKANGGGAGGNPPGAGTGEDAASRFRRLYIAVYVLVMGADWLQGAHIYALYRDQMGFPEETVARLFTAGFLSGAVSAYFVGSLADRFGRRLLCQSYCVLYALSCLSTLSRRTPVLYGGRLLGGVSTAILYSCFESWMVTEFCARGLARRDPDALGRLFGVLTAVNSVVAVAAGVVAEWLVWGTGTREGPFVAAAGMLVLAFAVVGATWNENYGARAGGPGGAVSRNAVAVVFNDPRILALAVSSCCLEASMYIFVFLWSPTLQSSRSSSSSSSVPLPYGIIFANFMACMNLGSHLFALSSMRHSRLLVCTFAAGGAALLAAVYAARSERAVFYGFCVFEACVGVYFPAMGTLKGRVVGDANRAGVYALMRMPVGVVVVGALAAVGRVRGEEMLLGCCGLLAAACGFVGHYVD